jgi:hypothetical protein
MWKLSISIRSLLEAQALVLAIALVFVGCSYDSSKLLVNKGRDSGSIGGSLPDGNGIGDGPVSLVGGAGGATTMGTGGATTSGGAGGAIGTGGAKGMGGTGGTGGTGADPYVYVVIYDREAKACNTNNPGADIDAVALARGSAIVGWGLTGSSYFIPNPSGDACTNAECNGANCKYAYNGTYFTEATLRPRTEGPPDAVVNASTDDVGYFSLNGGTLQIQIGNTVGGGVAQEIKTGNYVYVYEVDQTYVTAAYPTCTCAPEHYTVKVMSASGLLVKDLRPAALSAENATCAALTALSTEGCGTTTFVVP